MSHSSGIEKMKVNGPLSPANYTIHQKNWFDIKIADFKINRVTTDIVFKFILYL